MSSYINFKKTKEAIFKSLKDDKRREVLKLRFGLDGNKKETLEVIGKKFNVTRERIRQIEKIIFNEIASASLLKKTLDILSERISKIGGIVSEGRIMSDTGAKSDEEKTLLSLLLMSAQDIESINSRYFRNAWRNHEIKTGELEKIAGVAVSYLKDAKKPLRLSEIIKGVEEELKSYQKPMIEAVINASSSIDKDIDNNYGLVSWGVIRPKNTRDKAYVVFKEVKKPLHYKILTKLISEGDFASNKRVSVEAVHNELIRDQRFILVGRGIYALSEWGYNPGTVADVIEEIFKKEERSMHKDEIIKKVLEKRFVKKNTILLNLQEKPQFRRVKRAVYEFRG